MGTYPKGTALQSGRAHSCSSPTHIGAVHLDTHVQIYDGDTPQGDRPAIRERAQLLITNPDMLHR
eukprot:scaffold276549_cov22-Tisochrysis_lutea.AAC.1